MLHVGLNVYALLSSVVYLSYAIHIHRKESDGTLAVLFNVGEETGIAEHVTAHREGWVSPGLGADRADPPVFGQLQSLGCRLYNTIRYDTTNNVTHAMYVSNNDDTSNYEVSMIT